MINYFLVNDIEELHKYFSNQQREEINEQELCF